MGLSPGALWGCKWVPTDLDSGKLWLWQKEMVFRESITCLVSMASSRNIKSFVLWYIFKGTPLNHIWISCLNLSNSSCDGSQHVLAIQLLHSNWWFKGMVTSRSLSWAVPTSWYSCNVPAELVSWLKVFNELWKETWKYSRLFWGISLLCVSYMTAEIKKQDCCLKNSSVVTKKASGSVRCVFDLFLH